MEHPKQLTKLFKLKVHVKCMDVGMTSIQNGGYFGLKAEKTLSDMASPDEFVKSRPTKIQYGCRCMYNWLQLIDCVYAKTLHA